MMAERLTKHGITIHKNGICCTHFNCEECVKLQGNCSYGCQWEEKVWEKLAHYEDLEEAGRLIELPCKIGDTVYLRACCEIVLTSHDYETGTSECPFEDDCEFEECSNSNERIFRTSIQSIWNDGFDWKFTVRGLYIDFSLKDIGRYIFLTKEEAETALKGAEQ